jgi:hypothetical protein
MNLRTAVNIFRPIFITKMYICTKFYLTKLFKIIGFNGTKKPSKAKFISFCYPLVSFPCKLRP